MTQDEDHEVCPDCGYMRSPRAPCKCFKLAQGEDHDERARINARYAGKLAAERDLAVRQRDDWQHRAEMLQAEADAAHAEVKIQNGWAHDNLRRAEAAEALLAEAETREANTVKRIVEWIRSGGIDTAARIHPDNVADAIEREFSAPERTRDGS